MEGKGGECVLVEGEGLLWVARVRCERTTMMMRMPDDEGIIEE
jgi:hypothetical protein